MSSDQRPSRVRVFSSGGGMDIPARRRGDNPEAETLPDLAPEITAAPPVKSGGLGRLLLLACLFLLGCAIGGAVLAWLGFMPGAQS